YEAFCGQIGELPLSSSALGKRLGKRGIVVKRRSKGQRAYVGVSLADPSNTTRHPENPNESGGSAMTGDTCDGEINNSSHTRTCSDFTDLPSPPVTRHPDDEPTTADLEALWSTGR
ncbi:MAG: hypothetical protein ACRDMZ_18675, partial [Solirubrobacteraceae bacterium]